MRKSRERVLPAILLSLFFLFFCESCTKIVPSTEHSETEINSQAETTTGKAKTIPVLASEDTIRTTYSTSEKTMSKNEILQLYSAAANRITEKGEAGYKEKIWGKLSKVDSGDEKADDIFRYFADFFLTTKEEASEKKRKKGSAQAADSFPKCTLADAEFIKSAKCVSEGDNYKIEIVFVNDNPDEGGSHLAEVSNFVYCWNDIKAVLDKIPIIISTDEKQSQVVYNDYTITCTLTKDGEIISLSHKATIDVFAVAVVKLVQTYDVTFTAQFKVNCDYYGFDYN